MKVYQVQFDGEWDVVEAASFAEAVELWRRNLIAENGGDTCDPKFYDEEPEQIVLLSDKSIVRREET